MLDLRTKNYWLFSKTKRLTLMFTIKRVLQLYVGTTHERIYLKHKKVSVNIFKEFL